MSIISRLSMPNLLMTCMSIIKSDHQSLNCHNLGEPSNENSKMNIRNLKAEKLRYLYNKQNITTGSCHLCGHRSRSPSGRLGGKWGPQRLSRPQSEQILLYSRASVTQLWNPGSTAQGISQSGQALSCKELTMETTLDMIKEVSKEFWYVNQFIKVSCTWLRAYPVLSPKCHPGDQGSSA